MSRSSKFCTGSFLYILITFTKLIKNFIVLYLDMFNDTIVRRKKKIYSWTVDDEPAMHKMLNENVDAIITSDPTLLQSSMRDIRKKCLVDGYSIGS